MTMDLFQLRVHEGQKIIGEILHTINIWDFLASAIAISGVRCYTVTMIEHN